MWLIYGYGSKPQPRSYPKSYFWFFLEFFLDGYSPGHLSIERWSTSHSTRLPGLVMTVTVCDIEAMAQSK